MSRSEAVYERYRGALRAGHLAALAGALDAAVRSYRVAARIQPDRTGPYAALGRVLLASGHAGEALDAFGVVLGRLPTDTAALDGAAHALVELDRPEEAADLLDRLAAAHLEQQRHTDALNAMERAFDRAPSPERRMILDRMRRDSPAGATSRPHGTPAANGTTWLGRLTPQVDDRPPVSDEIRAVGERFDAAAAGGDVRALAAAARRLLAADRPRAAVEACLDALSLAPADPEIHRVLASISLSRGWQRTARTTERLVQRYQQVVDDPDEHDQRSEAALVAGDLDALLAIVEAHASQVRLATGLDLAYRALASAPADPRVYLAIARLHLALGWRGRAIDEVDRLAHFVEIGGDDEGRAVVSQFVNGALRTGA